MKTAFVTAALFLLAVAGCKAAKTYPDPLPGWHSPDYTTVFGRLQRIPARNPDNPPIWVIRFGLGSETYGGQFALTPQEKMIGFIGGEQVEIKGAIRTDAAPQPDYPGTWYTVQSAKMWSNYR